VTALARPRSNSTVIYNFKEKEKLVTDPDGRLTPGQTGSVTHSLTNVTLTLTSMLGRITLFMGAMGEGALHREDEVTV
jgi:hypothetical protein